MVTIPIWVLITLAISTGAALMLGINYILDEIESYRYDKYQADETRYEHEETVIKLGNKNLELEIQRNEK